jgi:anaerobic magnesium-protoporphyrin IX monomethyl ester cyclase
MKTLVLWPPHVPTYFNAGHRLPVFMVAQHLRHVSGIGRVTALDAGALNWTWKDLANRVATEQFDLIAVMNEYGVAAPIGQLSKYVRALSPRARIITFGRLSSEVPTFFRRYGIDAVIHSGDPEAGVAAYAELLMGRRTSAPGVAVRGETGWIEPAERGTFLQADTWPFPDVSEIPYEAYDQLYADDSNKFCGIPQRRELVVNVARGCPVNCEYCEVPRQQGLKERRRSVAPILQYIETCFQNHPFEYVAFYAPTFTLNPLWVDQLCEELIARRSRFPWKCTTTLHHVSEAMVAKMGKSGCVRISVGLETLDPPARDGLPKLKRMSDQRLETVAAWCRDASIELNCFVIVGMPGQSLEGARYTIAQVRRVGARVRPTIYTPYHEMRPDMSEEELESYDRQLLFTPGLSPEEQLCHYSLAFGFERNPTQAMDKIRVASSA